MSLKNSKLSPKVLEHISAWEKVKGKYSDDLELSEMIDRRIAFLRTNNRLI